MSQAHAALTKHARLHLARLIVHDGWSAVSAAKLSMVSPPPAREWAKRYREEGPAGMEDRSSRARSSPNRTPDELVRSIVMLRWRHRLSTIDRVTGWRNNRPQSVLSRISRVTSCGASHCGK